MLAQDRGSNAATVILSEAMTALAAGLPVHQVLAELLDRLQAVAGLAQTDVPIDVPAMTTRELEVLQLLSEGMLASSIAIRLAVSPRTVHKHLGSVYRKLGVHDRLVAVTLARRLGLLLDEHASPPATALRLVVDR